jgi:hypothetical protein
MAGTTPRRTGIQPNACTVIAGGDAFDIVNYLRQQQPENTINSKKNRKYRQQYGATLCKYLPKTGCRRSLCDVTFAGDYG